MQVTPTSEIVVQVKSWGHFSMNQAFDVVDGQVVPRVGLSAGRSAVKFSSLEDGTITGPVNGYGIGNEIKPITTEQVQAMLSKKVTVDGVETTLEALLLAGLESLAK